ncbi:DEAD/DEAH box helicase [Arenibacter sp. GZD96]|uniref:DEAD/DEAH box helicase n=1 Tax=Aurantibrevibacter litoralis TaxID=3106030 RepID=UPI002AFF444A|nr:DEAD/DEAH box helicase [Arenibacter sp. GZD-96]MEA1786828.1 DEAD/DEAH box helicase [Arenibacter sp. GZD-96]
MVLITDAMDAFTATKKPDSKEMIRNFLKTLQQEDSTAYAFKQGHLLYLNGCAQVLTQSKNKFELAVDDEFNDFKLKISVDDEIEAHCNCKSKNWCHHKVAGLLQISEIISRYDADGKPEGKIYTREGMIERVLEERSEKARKSNYRITFSNTVFGEHLLTNEKAKQYKLTFRDIASQKGYCSCPDYQTNKLGTCKHLMFAFEKFKSANTKALSTQYPFVEIFLNPLNNYSVSWFYPHPLPEEIGSLIAAYFDENKTLRKEKINQFLSFVQHAEKHKQIFIRPEVLDELEENYTDRLIAALTEKTSPDFSVLKATLYPYQKEGITFASYKKGAIIADEMGLGKTIQAIGTALLKKQLFGFTKTLVVCPASLKAQWKKEIEKFSEEKAVVVDGPPKEREKMYASNDAYFQIINYETVLRDSRAINATQFDFIILDEAQRIKNFETITANAIKSLHKKHALVITGTPIENKLIDLYSIVEFINPRLLAPLWEFSYQHCYFDHEFKNKITGYYNLQELKNRLKSLLLRREKQEVLTQINRVTQIDVPVEMHPIQQDYHASSAKAIAQILGKKFKTPFDFQMITKHLQTMRMACDSSYLVDKKSNHSPKVLELKEILLEKFDLKNNSRKIIIFSEWKRMLHIIGKMLGENGLGYVELSGDVPVKNRRKIIEAFENDINCRVFLSTEAGGAGLNLQMADTVINFELPWNPAKKNQRIGRIDRLGQQNKNLTVINLITRESIEMKIASGLIIKQNLFESVLSPENNEDVVDFSDKGRAQFLQQLEEMMSDFTPLDSTFENRSEVEEIAITPSGNQTQLVFENSERKEQLQRLEDMENIMNKGLEFLSGMFKMSTGKELFTSENKMEVNKETGEVVMRFKLPI